MFDKTRKADMTKHWLQACIEQKLFDNYPN